MNQRVVVAMSGGVDSSVAAVLLVERGYEVIGVTMQIWPEATSTGAPDRSCCSLGAVEDARRVAFRLGIPYYVLNLREDFERDVIRYFCDEYLRGRTPNPCVVCNAKVKFRALLDKARRLGASYVATGHYAKVVFDEKRQRFLLKKAKDTHKDQTYALYALDQEQLGHALFPLGDLTKPEVRQLAQRAGLPVAARPESQEICFVSGGSYRDFLRERAEGGFTPGPILDTSGRVIGKHNGIADFTVGQRKGLGIPSGKRLYVLDIRPEDNAVVVGTWEEGFSRGLVAGGLNWIAFSDPAREAQDGYIRAEARIRYNAPAVPARISPLAGSADWDRVEVSFDRAQRAISPGQACVFYEGELVLGGGTIERRLPDA